MKYKTLASYPLVPDGSGMIDKLTLNAKHFVKVDDIWEWDWGGDWGLYETITHEVAHPKHKHRGKSKPHHGSEFRGILLDLGIFCTPYGTHWKEAEEAKPFAVLTHEWAVKRLDSIQSLADKSKVSYWEPEGERKQRGKSILHPWICPESGQKLRAIIKGDIDSTHDACGVGIGSIWSSRASSLCSATILAKRSSAASPRARLARRKFSSSKSAKEED